VRGTSAACSGPWTSVYVNGFAGYPGANSGSTANLETGYPDTAWCNALIAGPTPDGIGAGDSVWRRLEVAVSMVACTLR
jgi:hypothetical protein